MEGKRNKKKIIGIILALAIVALAAVIVKILFFSENKEAQEKEDAMNAAAARLLRYYDFTAFAKLNSNNKTILCHIFEARWHTDESGAVFVFAAVRFLRNMVRAVVGTLVDVGRGRLSVEQFDEIVAARDLSRLSGLAPAQGLVLYDILYPADVFIRKWRRNDSGPLAPLTLCDM